MITIVMTIMAAMFLFFKPPLPTMKPHLTEPPSHTYPSSVQAAALPAVVTPPSALPDAASATAVPPVSAPSALKPAAATSPKEATPSPLAPPASTPPAGQAVANPTLALAFKEPSAREALYHRVAARSLGEGSFAVPEIACTIKNRLQVSGASINAVLQAYYARDVHPQPAHIELVRQVFEGELPCPPTWWYALSLQDTRHWKPHSEPAFVIRRNNRSQIWIFHH